MEFSLIIATIGRRDEVVKLLASIDVQRFDLSQIELIIVDQNNDRRIEDAIRPFYRLQIRHIKSTQPGLSYNRNIGLRAARGRIICFPDDDCMFYEDTLSSISAELSDEKNDFVIGRIVDRATGNNIIRNWPKNKKTVNRVNFYFLSSSITIFLKRNVAPIFNENLGAGCPQGSCEDVDYVYRLLQARHLGIYTPSIELWHPTPDFSTISLSKVRLYASGFGYFVSDKPDIIKCALLAMLLGKKISQAARNVFTSEFSRGYFFSFFSGLREGMRAARRGSV